MTTNGPDNSQHRPAPGIDLSAWSDDRLARALDAVDAGPDACSGIGENGGEIGCEIGGDESSLLMAMAADRAHLRSLHTDPVPSGLLVSSIGAAFDDDTVLESDELDGDMLAGLNAGPTTDDGLPVSSVVPERGGVIGWIGRHRTECGLALAAAATLLVGGPALLTALEREEPGVIALNEPEPGLDWSGAIIEGTPADQPAAVEIARAAEPVSPADVLTPREALASFGGPVESLFAGEELMLEARLLLVVRGTRVRAVEAIEPMVAFEVGPNHSFAMAGAMSEEMTSALPLPEIGAPVMAMDDTRGLMRVELPERSGWSALVRPTANGLASLIDALEDAGLSVEMRSMPEPVSVEAETLAGAGPRRTVTLPVIVEALP